MKSLIYFRNIVLVLALAGTEIESAGQSTTFTYQGRLQVSSLPAQGSYDMELYLRDAATGGNPVGLTNIVTTSVTDGLFTALLDFGSAAWGGADRWLEIGIRTNGSASAYTILSPRQKITSSPYAITAANLSSPLTTAGLAGAYSNAVTLSNGTNQFSGSFSGSFTGNGGGLTNVSGVTAANYLSAYDTNSQSIAFQYTFQDVIFGNNGHLDGWTHTPGSASFGAAQSGLYLFQYIGSAQRLGGVSGTLTVRGTINGTEVTGSASTINFLSSSQVMQISGCFIVSMSAGDTLKLHMAASSTSISLVSPTGGLGATNPSITVTAVRIQ